MPLVIVADPLDLLQPYAEEHAAALAAGADFVLGDGTFAALRDADAILTAWTMRFTPAELRALNRCQLIVRYGVGVDNIDIAAATACGIVVANAPTYCVSEVADHTAGLILSITRGIPWLDRQVRDGSWMAVRKDDPRVPRVSQITLGIVGIGKIGQRVAQRMAPFGCRILAHDPFLSDTIIRERGAIPVASLAELLRLSDVVSLHVPLTAQTQHLIDETALRLVKSTAVVINTSRGGVIDEAALVRALQEDRLYGAALDVLATEPLALDHPLLAIDPRRVILTPHFGAWCAASVPDLHAEVASALAALLAGRWPAATINPEVTPRLPLQK
jgi:D-3-phosphoglycerate dehydrogenase / 2-oxoglutarate reductase